MFSGVKQTQKRIMRASLRALFKEEKRPSSYLGLTFAVGFSAGMFIFYAQSLLCVLIWLILDRWLKIRFNVIIASLLTFISNPLTTPFILYVYYLTGQAMLGDSVISMTAFWSYAKAFLVDTDGVSLWDGFKLLLMGIGRPIALGSLPWHVIMAFVGYYTGVRFHWWLHKLIDKKRLLRIERKAEKSQCEQCEAIKLTEQPLSSIKLSDKG